MTIREIKNMLQNKRELKVKNRVKLKKYITKQCECSGTIEQYKNVYNRFPIKILLINVKINKMNVDHVWVECEDLYKYFLKDEIVSFIADVEVYYRDNGNLAYGLCNLQNIKTLNKKRC